MKLITTFASTLLALASVASGETLVQWVPFAGTSPYLTSEQTPPPTIEALGVSSSPLTRVNFSGNFNNAGASWPGNTNNALGEAGVLDPINGAYTEFTVSPPVAGSVTYASISYQLSSFGGMNNDDGYTGIVRTNLDAFDQDLTTTTITNQTSANFLFDISSLGEQTEAVTFRLYFVNNNAAANFADLSAVNGGLIVDGTSSETDRVAEEIAWTGAGSSAWVTNGDDGNWDSSDATFRAGDSVLFGDDVAEDSSGVIEIENFVNPASTTVDSDIVNYELIGLLGGSGPLVKAGESLLQLRSGEGFSPLTGPIDVQGGVMELVGSTTYLTLNPSITVGPEGTFRVAEGNDGQDSLPPITLSGGNLEFNNTYFLFPTGRSITLTEGTTSTISSPAAVRTFSDAIVGEGNLVKTGTGTLSTIDGVTNGLGHTGSTTIEEGAVTIGGANTTSSSEWSISNGRLNLEPDAGAPIANFPAESVFSLDGNAFFDANNNMETIGSLSMDSTTGRNLLTVQDGAPSLITTELVLTGTENQVIFIPNLGPDASGTFPVMTATNVTGELGTNLTAFGIAPEAQTWTQDAATGLISVTINLDEGPSSLTYTNESGAGVWSLREVADWATPEMTATSFFNFAPTVLGDEPFTEPGELTVDLQDNVRPLSTTFSNSLGNDYMVTGLAIIDSGSVTINGGGQVTFDNGNTYTGGTLVAGDSTLVLSAEGAVSPLSEVTVESGSTLDIEATNGLFRQNITDAAVTLNGGTLLQSAGFHLNLNSIVLNSGAIWSATSENSFDDENAQILGSITVGGDSPSQIGPFSFGLGLAAEQNADSLGGVFLDVANASGDSAVDLMVSAQLEDAVNVSGGFTKFGEGTMLLSAENVYTGATGVFTGTLLISDPTSIPQAGVGTTVFSGGQFGFVTSEVSDADIVAIANNLSFDVLDDPEFGALTFFVPAGETATFSGDLSGGAFANSGGRVTVQGGGTIDFAGAVLPVDPTTDDGSTIIGVGAAGADPATVISDFTIAIAEGTNSGLQATLTFVADGAVDVYSSGDLESFTRELSGVLPGASPVVLDDLSADAQFFVLVSAGSQFPVEEP